MTPQEAIEKLSEHNSEIMKTVVQLTDIVSKLLVRIEKLE